MSEDPSSGAAWPKFVAHKIVRAAPICEILHRDGKVLILVKPYGDDRVERFEPSEPSMAGRAEIGGYAVAYADGFRSVSPRVAFETGYSPVDDSD